MEDKPGAAPGPRTIEETERRMLAGFRRWRVGRKVGRTIYVQRGDEPADGDELIGMMDNPSLARLVVDAVNEYTGLLDA